MKVAGALALKCQLRTRIMAKRRRTKARRVRTPRDIQKFAGVYIAQHPFNQLDKEKLRGALLEMGHNAGKQFEAQSAELQQMLNSVDALQAIACLASYGLTVGVGKDGEVGESYKGDKFAQAHVEIAIAFALRTPDEARGRQTADGEDIQRLFDLLPKVSTSFSHKRLVRASELATEGERSIAELQEHLRLHTQSVRNWGYFDEVVATFHGLVAPIDEAWEAVLGVRGSTLIRFFQDQVKRMEERFTAKREFFREIDAASTLDDFLARLFVFFPAPDEYQKSFAHYVHTHAPLSRSQRRAAMLHYSDALSHLDFLVFTAELAEGLGVGAEALERCLGQVSLAFGDLSNVKDENLLLANPVWTRPLISLGDGVYYCALPQAFFSFAFQILNDIASKNADLSAAWTRRKAEFLEREIELAFRTAFPTAKVVPNYKWKQGGADYENDLIIQVGSHLVIIEAKSGAVSWPALRGAPDRAKKHFRELIVEPSIQSLRLKETIAKAAGDPANVGAALASFPFDLKTIKRTLRLSVTLEDFGLLQTNLSLAIDAGWAPEQHELAPTMILGDLKALFEILETKAEKIHYLQRRQVVQTSIDYVGDEMDLLGLYLANGFDVGGMEGGKVHLLITGMSAAVDEYREARILGFAKRPPRRKLSKWWRDICAKFEEREFDGWTEPSTVLLDVGFDDQRKFEAKFRQVKRNVMRHWKEPGHLSSAILVPSMARSDAIVAYAYRDVAAKDRRNAMESVAVQVFDSHDHVKRCLVLGMNLDKGHYPYSTLAIFTRRANGHVAQ